MVPAPRAGELVGLGARERCSSTSGREGPRGAGSGLLGPYEGSSGPQRGLGRARCVFRQGGAVILRREGQAAQAAGLPLPIGREPGRRGRSVPGAPSLGRTKPRRTQRKQLGERAQRSH